MSRTGLNEVVGFRADVEGLRAVAVLMVLLYHLGVPYVTGGFAGVDVFFVISGFLITSQLVKEAEHSGGISLPAFYARRAKRLFPAAALTLIAAVICAWLWLPSTRWAEMGGDVFAAAFYFINWRLAARSVDYLAEDSVSSPVQHFWSLAVEEQYYLVWPLLLALAVWFGARRFGVRRVAWFVLALVALPSLAWSIHLTKAEPALAYFVTTTRMWELAIGGAVALLAPQLPRLKPPPAAVLGWIGLLAIFVSLFFQSAQTTPWPGYAAALPTLGAGAVIAGGFAAGTRGPIAVLGIVPMRWIGGVSYSLYLWHWLLIAFWLEHHDDISLAAGTVLATASVLLAWLSRRFVEDPVRYSRTMSAHPRYALSAGLNFSFAGAVFGLALIVLAGFKALPSITVDGNRPMALGAAVLREAPRGDPAGAPLDRVEWITPAPEDATKDVPDVYAKGCQLPPNNTRLTPCEYGDPRSETTVAIVGDSKMAQWTSAMERLALKHGWRLVTHTKSACKFNAKTQYIDKKPYVSCTEWNGKLLRHLVDSEKPDFVITSAGRGTPPDSISGQWDDMLTEGYLEWWQQLHAAGTEVIALADTPYPGKQVYECVSMHREQLGECTFPRKPGGGTKALRRAARRMGIEFVDLTDAICPTKRCAPVIGNVLIYRQGSHLTKTYVDTLTPRLEKALLAAGLPAGGSTASSGAAPR